MNTGLGKQPQKNEHQRKTSWETILNSISVSTLAISTLVCSRRTFVDQGIGCPYKPYGLNLRRDSLSAA
jgi:hypothetical protein